MVFFVVFRVPFSFHPWSCEKKCCLHSRWCLFLMLNIPTDLDNSWNLPWFFFFLKIFESDENIDWQKTEKKTDRWALGGWFASFFLRDFQPFGFVTACGKRSLSSIPTSVLFFSEKNNISGDTIFHIQDIPARPVWIPFVFLASSLFRRNAPKLLYVFLGCQEMLFGLFLLAVTPGSPGVAWLIFGVPRMSSIVIA